MQALGAFVLITLAATFVTWTITTAQVALPLRRAIANRNGRDGWWTYLIHCPYCTAFWVAVPAGVYWEWLIHAGWGWLAPVIGAIAVIVPRILAFDRES